MITSSKPPLLPENKRFLFQNTIWLGGEHDGHNLLPFDEYSKRRTKPLTKQEEAAALQSLLTFGLLEAVMEFKITESELLDIDKSSRQQVVTDTHLPRLLQRWRSQIRKLQLLPDQDSKNASREWAHRIQLTFSQAQLLLMQETVDPHHSVFRQAGLELHEQAQVMVLIGSIIEALTISSKAFPIDVVPRGLSATFVLILAKQQKADMVATGWCPFAVEILGERVCTLGYASVHRPHGRESVDGHRKCNPKACVINTLDVNSHKPQHIIDSCRCEAYGPALGDIVGALEAGKVPVLRCLQADTLESSDSSNTSYVAISHVWADGLGSTTEAGLPSCQIRKLATVIEGLLPGGGFWIDALCVPAIQDMRKRAIGLMAQTYKEATAVLVLDSGIRSISCSASREEKLLGVMSSGWMQRLWTLQEGILAQKLVFEFSDGLRTLEDLLPVGEEHFNTVLSCLAAEVFRLTKHRSMRTQQKSDLRFGDVAQALRWRTSSRPSDETLAISGLLNVDALELVNLPPEERMQGLLLRLRSLPSSILFIPGMKMSQPGFRWAPKSLMRAFHRNQVFGTHDASCTPSGLVAKYALAYFPTITIDAEAEWYIRDLSNHRIYKLSDLWLGPDAAENGYFTTYACNAILLMGLPAPSELTACAVVFFPKAHDDPGVCDFKKRLVLKEISEAALARENVRIIVDAKFGKMVVRVT